jgi:glycosyltransferase involved in cell wall biosynthesis
MPFKKIAAIIPCRNEAASISEVIAKFPRSQLLQHNLQLEVYVIDNNSSDNTAAVAKKAGASVIYEPKQGKGNALRAAFYHLPGDIDYIVMIDGDDTYSPAEILRMVEPLRSDFCDVVVGSRLSGHIQKTAMTQLNRFGNRIFTTATRSLYGANVTDVLTGYFAWKKAALDQLRPYVTSPGFAIEMEMITKMARLGQRMTSVPISYHPRSGESHLHPFRDGLRISLMLLKNLTWRPRQTEGMRDTARAMALDVIPRRIVFVSDSIYPYMMGGKEKRLYEITKRLATMGHDVHIYTMHWWQDPSPTKMESGVQLHAICRHHELYKGDRRTVKEAVLFGLACFKLFWVRFDVLDVDHMPFFPIFSTWIVCVLRRRKLYATWHEALSRQDWVSYMGSGGLVAALIERMSISLPHRITAASAHTKELLETIHGRVKRVELVASGIDTSLLQAVRSIPVHCDVLYVGRLVKDKHVDMLIAAIEIVARSDPSIHCVIIGQGIEKPRLKRKVTTKKLQQNITFLDPLPEAADVYAFMKSAKVFCSASSREGFGITSLEALGCGTPVITTNSPANAARHLVHDGQNGSVVSPNPQAIAEAIVYWIDTMRKPAITAHVAEYDWDHLAQKQAQVYTL